MSHTGDSILSVQGLSVQLEGRSILTHISFEVETGERIFIVGPSSSGKTTLLKAMAGLIGLSGGTIRIQGRPLGECLQNRAEFSTWVGMSFQKSGLFDWMTAIENIAFPLRECRLFTQKEVIERAHEALKAVGLDADPQVKPSELSGGMQKRLAIARALALRPKVLLLDDPTAGLDPITATSILERLIEIQTEHRMTLVAVTSEVRQAEIWSDRIAFLVKGCLVALNDRKAFLQSPDARVRQFVSGSLRGPLTAEAES